MLSANLFGFFITVFHFVSGLNNCFWSNSVSGKWPIEVVGTSLVKEIIPIEDSFASTTPGKIYVAPPPLGPSHIPTFPVTRA